MSGAERRITIGRNHTFMCKHTAKKQSLGIVRCQSLIALISVAQKSALFSQNSVKHNFVPFTCLKIDRQASCRHLPAHMSIDDELALGKNADFTSTGTNICRICQKMFAPLMEQSVPFHAAVA